jgi:mono/diheme cytochrome c family protein
MKRTHFMMLASIVAGVFLLMSFVIPQEQKKPSPWTVPADYVKKANPYNKQAADLEQVGKMLWAKHCKSCHGNNGHGDGPKSRQLDTNPGDFTVGSFQTQPDGSLYYKSFVGRDEMPNYEKKIPDEEDRWALIIYMRSMGK